MTCWGILRAQEYSEQFPSKTSRAYKSTHSHLWGSREYSSFQDDCHIPPGTFTGRHTGVSAPNRSALKKSLIQGMVCYAHFHGEAYAIAPDPPNNQTEAAIPPGFCHEPLPGPLASNSPLVPVSKQSHPSIFPEFHSDLAPPLPVGKYVLQWHFLPPSLRAQPSIQTLKCSQPLCLQIHTMPVLPPLAPASKLSVTNTLKAAGLRCLR